MDNNLSQRVAAELRAEMARRQMSTKDLAQRTGLSLYNRLSGRVSIDLDELQTICDALGLVVTVQLGAQVPA